MLRVRLVGYPEDRTARIARRLARLGADVIDARRQPVPTGAADAAVLVENLGPPYQRGLGAPVHLVVGVAAADGPPDVVLQREVDVWLDGAAADDAVDELWHQRLAPFADNLRRRSRAPRRRTALLCPPDPRWPEQAARLIARLTAAVGPAVHRVDHIGSTAVPGLCAKDLVDVQVVVDDLGQAAEVAEACSAAGFVHVPGPLWGRDAHGKEHPEHVVVDADPGRPVNVNIRPATAPVWRATLLLRDYLRSHPHERDAYADTKRALARQPGASADVDWYGEQKMPWIYAALARADRWATAAGWTP